MARLQVYSPWRGFELGSSWLGANGGTMILRCTNMPFKKKSGLCNFGLFSMHFISFIYYILTFYMILDEKDLQPYRHLTCESSVGVLVFFLVIQYLYTTFDIYLSIILIHQVQFSEQQQHSSVLNRTHGMFIAHSGVTRSGISLVIVGNLAPRALTH